MVQDFSKVITFDGTAGSGKGTIAKRIADHYGCAYLDTGKLYRALALLIIKEKNTTEINNKKKLNQLVNKITTQILANEDLYKEEVTNLSSQIAADPLVRESLYSFQRNFILSNEKTILDGRDTGSVICPEASHKFYIDADLQVRAERRYMQNKQYYDAKNISVANIKDSLNIRDIRDKTRKIAPLTIAEGAIIIDNSQDGFADTIKKIIDLIDY